MNVCACVRVRGARTHVYVCMHTSVLDFDYGVYNIVVLFLSLSGVVISKKSHINVVLGPIKSSNARKI